MTESCFVLLCGLPGVGKSSVANQLSEKLVLEHARSVDGNAAKEQEEKHSETHNLTICYDSIIPNNLYKEDDQNDPDVVEKSWKKQRRQIINFISAFLELHRNDRLQKAFLDEEKKMPDISDKIDAKCACCCLKQLIRNNRCCCRNTRHIIIIDDNMFYASMRYEYYQIARKYGAGFLQVYVTCDLGILLQRNDCRAEPVSNDTIYRMKSKFEVPDAEKNEWEKNTITLNTSSKDTENSLTSVIDLIKYCFKHPVEPLPEEYQEEKEESRQVNLKSILHQTDNVVRKLVSFEIKYLKETQPKGAETTSLIMELGKRKKNFLASLKTSNDILEQLREVWTFELNSGIKAKEQRDDSAVQENSSTVSTDEFQQIINIRNRSGELVTEEDNCFEKAVKALFINFREAESVNLS